MAAMSGMRHVLLRGVAGLGARTEPDSFADVVTLFLLDGAKINKSAPAAVPGTTDHGRPVGAAPPP